MFKVLLLTFCLATSCLAAPTEVPEKELSPLCKDLEMMVKWDAAKGTKQQWEQLQKLCVEGDNTTPETPSNDVVDRMTRCGKLENSDDMKDPVKKEALDNCILELNCYKRFYMEGANLSPDDFKKEFPLVWRGKAVNVGSPPSDTFIDTDPSKPSCSKFSLSTEKTQDKLTGLASGGVARDIKKNLDKVKGDIMSQIQREKELAFNRGTNTAQNQDENVEQEMDKLLSDIVDGIFKIISDPAMKGEETKEAAKMELKNIQQLLAIIPKYNPNSFVGKLLDSVQQGSANQMSPVVAFVNNVFEALNANTTEQEEPAVKLEASPDEDKKE